MLQGDNISLYYSGDTGYSSHFREIPDLFGAPDYALLGIGAYKPRWFMRPNHISPYESLTACQKKCMQDLLSLCIMELLIVG